ncbi:calcium-binding protein [Algicella marina]|uniref:Calcium-binding protein n=1 Tax=Algicella marina TaxID=2683284 RepID=A0A6P1T2E9_9RHOB|nr:calcium-binding protein [Algicella marina]QHQ35489.1 hypothetical protein GO499_09955 [Algicella marina]
MPPLPTRGDDSIYGTDDPSVVDRLTGLEGNDYINAGDGNDFVFEGAWNWGGGLIDMFGDIPELTPGEPVDFGGGEDILDGGAGFDELNYYGYTQSVYMNFQTNRIIRNGETDIFRNFEWVVLSDADDVVITNDNAKGVLLQAGDDTVVGFADISEIFGGTGIDTVDCSQMQVNILLDARNGITRMEGGWGGTIAEFEIYIGSRNYRNTIITDDVSSTVTGGNVRDILRGGAGNDTINGKGGNDTIRGGNGNDTLRGGDGDDNMIGGGGRNTVQGGNGADTILNESANGTISGGNGNDFITSNGNNSTINGGAHNDTIASTGADVTIGGGNGADDISSTGARAVIHGGNGNDVIEAMGTGAEVRGGGGNDDIFLWRGRAFGGDGDDTISVHGSYSGSTLNLGAGDDVAQLRGTGNTVYAGSGADLINVRGQDHRVFGGDGADRVNIGTRGGNQNQTNATVQGNGGNDNFFVFAGADAILGGGGADTFNFFTNSTSLTGIAGGWGADRFNFNEFGNDATVRISDFNTGMDRLDIRGISGLGDLDSLTNQNGNAVLRFTQESRTLDPGNDVQITLTLEGVAAGTLTDDIFL